MKPFISFCLLLCICLGKLYAQGVNIVYIGNSITQGALLKTPVTGGGRRYRQVNTSNKQPSNRSLFEIVE